MTSIIQVGTIKTIMIHIDEGEHLSGSERDWLERCGLEPPRPFSRLHDLDDVDILYKVGWDGKEELWEKEDGGNEESVAELEATRGATRGYRRGPARDGR